MRPLDTCSLDTCPLSQSPYGYQPTIAGNAIFLAIFTLSLLACLVVTVVKKGWLKFSALICAGCVFEIVGYAVRIASWHNPWNVQYYADSTALLSIGPCFVSAALYLTLSEVVLALGLRKGTFLDYARHCAHLIWLEAVALALQVVGNAVAFSDLSAARGLGPRAPLGNQIIAAGVGVQVFCLTAMMAVLCIIVLRGSAEEEGGGGGGAGKRSRMLRGKSRTFVVILVISALCIWIRGLYNIVMRVTTSGFGTPWSEAVFAAFDGAFIFQAVVGLVFVHPGRFKVEVTETPALLPSPQCAENGRAGSVAAAGAFGAGAFGGNNDDGAVVGGEKRRGGSIVKRTPNLAIMTEYDAKSGLGWRRGSGGSGGGDDDDDDDLEFECCGHPDPPQPAHVV